MEKLVFTWNTSGKEVEGGAVKTEIRIKYRIYAFSSIIDNFFLFFGF